MLNSPKTVNSFEIYNPIRFRKVLFLAIFKTFFNTSSHTCNSVFFFLVGNCSSFVIVAIFCFGLVSNRTNWSSNDSLAVYFLLNLLRTLFCCYHTNIDNFLTWGKFSLITRHRPLFQSKLIPYRDHYDFTLELLKYSPDVITVSKLER